MSRMDSFLRDTKYGTVIVCGACGREQLDDTDRSRQCKECREPFMQGHGHFAVASTARKWEVCPGCPKPE